MSDLFDVFAAYIKFWLRIVAVLLLLAIAAAAGLGFLAGRVHGAEAPSMPNADAPTLPAPPAKASITLDAPKEVTAGSGYFKVKATATGAVAFDVEAQFEEEGVNFQSEQLDATTYLIGVPASAGVVRVQAATCLPGGPPVFAKVFIVIAAAPKKDPPPAAAAPVGKLYAVFIADAAKPDVSADKQLADGVKAAGDDLLVLDKASPAIADQGLTKFVADAGGAPALILLDEKGSVHKAVKTPATVAEVLSLLSAVHKGK